ncbi:MAG: CoA pyrophosphatase [Deltaproteobacteria bacterium]|nr:CoA pyrophosphatase [Deltaproteobacteria bacterium]
MNSSATVPSFLENREGFLKRIVERLGRYPSDFQSLHGQIQASAKTTQPRLAAGVLVPLLFAERRTADPGPSGYAFQLLKRSARVSQPGDLSCPGGIIHPRLDPLLGMLLRHGGLPILDGAPRSFATRRGADSARLIASFLANALRESWEEIRLSPCRVRFLGPLPTYTLTLFRRTIFPLVGFVEKPGPLRPNREVERLVEIPLAAFYDADRIGCYRLSSPDPRRPHLGYPLDHPCLIHRNPDGGEEILWGATFQILTQFLEIVLDYRLPAWQKGRVIERTLPPRYLNGSVPP